METLKLTLLTIVAISLFVVGSVNAEQVSPMESGNTAIEAGPKLAAETAVRLVDRFNFNWVLVRQRDGSYNGIIDGGRGPASVWVVVGQLSSTAFEFHAVNPTPMGDLCGSFIWDGFRSGTMLDGWAHNEPTFYNEGIGCTFDAAAAGTLTVILP